jgi:MSHA biogenesis protein MshN
MSIINRMLQDLDRRQGTSDPDATLAMSQVRTVPAQRKEREWFWRIIAVLMIAALGWVGWIAWQLQPREPVVTAQAFKAAEAARRKPASAPGAAVEAKAPEQKPAAGSPSPEKPAAQAPEALKLAEEIETPVRNQAPKPAAAAPKAKESEVKSTSAADKTAEPVTQAAPRVEKRDRVRRPEDRAEADFRRGVALLNQGRVAEAEDSFQAALAAHAGHEAARQALIALSLEQRKVDEARRLLQEGLALNPANARFAAVLARILIERKDYAAALEATDGVRTQAEPELQMMRGTALQRLGRHAEAAEAFQASLRAAPQNGASWMALAISLEAQDKRPEAVDAFKRAAAASNLSVGARDYAEQRARALQ